MRWWLTKQHGNFTAKPVPDRYSKMDLSTSGDNAISSGANLNTPIIDSNAFLNQLIQSASGCGDQNLITNSSNGGVPASPGRSDLHQTSIMETLERLNISGGSYNEYQSGDCQRTHQFQLCAAPLDICQAAHSVPDCTVEAFCPNVYVECSSTGCNFAGNLHPNCLNQWTILCRLQCQLLSQHTQTVAMSTASPSGNPQAETKTTLLLADLFQLYKCPVCWQPSLCRIGNAGDFLGPSGQQSTAESLASVFTAIQLVNSQLSREPLEPHRDSSNQGNELSGQQHLNGPLPFDRSMPEVSGSGCPEPINSAPPHQSFTETSQFDFDLDLEKDQKFSWPGSSWPNSMSMKRHPQRAVAKPMSIRSEVMRLGSSGSTSGYYSGSSVSSIAEQSLEHSQRTSLGICNENDLVLWPTNQESNKCSMGSPFTSVCKAFWVGEEGNTSNSTRTRRESQVKEDPEKLSIKRGEDNQLVQNAPPQVTDLPVMETNPMLSGDAKQSSCSSTVKVREGRQVGDSKRKPLNVNRKGNIFLQRNDFNVFERLPPVKRNAYFVYLDDDSCTGNEDTRAFLLAQLTQHRVSELTCLVCHCSLVVYDHFPIVDGVLFLSPVCHRATGGVVQGLRVQWHSHGQVHRGQTGGQGGDGFYGANGDATGELVKRLVGDQAKPVIPPPGCLGPRQQVTVGNVDGSAGGKRSVWSRPGGRQERYLHALCLSCVHEMAPSAAGAPEAASKIHCRVCNRPWSGASLLVGGLYTYDIFAATPCCLAHLACNSCGRYLDKRSVETTNCSPASSIQDLTAPESSPASPPLPFFSQYSQLITCLFCGKEDYHFVKSFAKYYQGIHHMANS